MLDVFQDSVLTSISDIKDENDKVDVSNEDIVENIDTGLEEDSNTNFPTSDVSMYDPSTIKRIKQNARMGAQMRMATPENFFIQIIPTQGSNLIRIYLFILADINKNYKKMFEIINTATENDTVEIYLNSFMLDSWEMSYFFSSIKRCKAKTVAKVDYLVSYQDVAIALLCDSISYTDASLVCCRPMTSCTYGTLEDRKVDEKHDQEFANKIYKLITDSGFMTAEEQQKIIEDSSIFFSHGVDLKERFDAVKSTGKDVKLN